MAYQIQVRNDIADNWTDINPVLAQGEPGYETDTGRIKYGDGQTAWNSLPYFSVGNNPGIPGGPNTSIQFNNTGSFEGSANLRWYNPISTLSVIGNVKGSNFIGGGNGLNLTGLNGDLIPAANNGASLGNATHQWKELWVSNTTIFIGGVPLSMGANTDLTFNGSPIVTTSTDPNVTTQIAGDINIAGDMLSSSVVASNSIQAPTVQSTTVVSNTVQASDVVANYFSGDGGNVYNISYSNVVGGYGDANVAAYLANATGNISAGYYFGNVAFATGFPTLDNYSNSNVAAYLPTDPTVVAIQSNVAGLQANSYSNANAAAFLSTYSGNVTADSLIVGNTTTPGTYFLSATANSVSMGSTAAQYVAVLDTGIEIVGTAGVTVGGINGGTVTLGGATSGDINVVSAINLGDVANVHIGGGTSGQILATDGAGELYWTNDTTTYGNANVAAYLPSDPTILSLQSSVAATDANVLGLSNSLSQLSANVNQAWVEIGDINANISNTDSNVATLAANVANAWTAIGVLEANVYSNANAAAFLSTYSGNTTADTVTANILTVGDTANSGGYFIQSTANSVSLGQTGGQTLSFSDTSGITLAGTGGVTIMGAAGATVTLGGGTSGSILVESAISLGDVSNVHIDGGSSGQILATDGSGNLYWTNDTTTYGNSNVAAYLPGYGGNISVDVVTASGNVDAGTNFFIGNGAFLTGLDAATGYSNSNVEALLPVYSGDLNANVITANAITANVISNTISTSGNVTAAYFIGDGSQLTNLPILDAYSNANVASYLPIYSGNLLANVVTASNTVSNTISTGTLAANSASVAGNAVANILVTPNNRVGTPRANGNTDKVTLYSIPGNWNYALGTDSTHMWFGTGAGADGFSWYNAGALVMQTTGPDLFVEGEVSADTFTACSVMSTATVSTDNLIANNVISVDGSFSGNLLANTGNIDTFVANTIVANSVTTAYDMVSVQTTANTIVLGNATTAVNQISWATATSNTTSNVTLFSVPATNISSIDFGITATSSNNRQVAKILAVTLGNSFNYTEYGSLSIGSLLGNFFVDVIGGNLVLQVQPFVSANIHYSLIMDYDYDLHL